MSDSAEPTVTEIRRDLHAHAETGWKEFRTTALIASELEDEFTLFLGSDAVDPDERLGVPANDEIATAIDRARSEGAGEAYLDRMDGITGLVATKEFGDGSGPVVGVRVDIDALERTEASDDDHQPTREGFASQHPNAMHACGHDGHTAIGLGLARAIDGNHGFNGTLKLFFQPAEEGGRGGKPMSETSHLDDLEYLLSLHLGLGQETGTVIASYDKPLSNAKVDAVFEGEPAHAGDEPNEGRNAVQAMATAIQNLYAIPRHADGTTRINVGQVHSPNPQNIIAEEARMRVEVRGETADLNEYMHGEAQRILKQAAAMHDVDLSTSLYGKTTTFVGDEELVGFVEQAAEVVEGVDNVLDRYPFGASEDASFLIRRIQENGGKATYLGIGASNPSGHHTARFDIDEEALQIGVDVLANTIRSL
jgi:aminobenzoyl-glutamate utilization protein A